MKAREEMRQNL